MHSLIIQENIIKSIRGFFDSRGFHEIITPVFNDAVPLEPNIYPFKTTWHPPKKEQTFFLSTSPERSLKLALAEGIGNCYAIGHSFRDLEGSGPYHSPEFLMLEWYREDADYRDIMRDAQELTTYVKDKFEARNSKHETERWPTLSLVDLFQTHCNITINQSLTDEFLKSLAQKKGYQTKGATWSQLFDQIFLNEIEPHLPKTPLFLIDYPARISPLCKPQTNNPYLAERFELYINGIEIGNGNTENTDAASIKKIFIGEQKSHPSATLIDTQFLEALEKLQKKSYAGMGLGVERLLSLLTQSH